MITHSLSNLVTLHFWNCGLTDQQFQIISCIVVVGVVRQVSIDYNASITEGIFATLISEESCIRLLSLRGNRIGDSGAKQLAIMLKSNRVLTMLDLFDNKIKKAGAEDFGEALKVNKCLQSLGLGRNSINDEGVHLLCRALSNYILSSEEVQQRKKVVSEADRLRQEVDDDNGKKRGVRRIPSFSTPKVDTKKVTKATAPPKRAVEPTPPVKASKPVEDPKTKKIAEKVIKKVPAKGKKGKSDELREENDDLPDLSVALEPMFELNSQWFLLGNRTLNSLNLSFNDITNHGLQILYDILCEQEATAEQATDGMLGLFKLSLAVLDK